VTEWPGPGRPPADDPAGSLAAAVTSEKMVTGDVSAPRRTDEAAPVTGPLRCGLVRSGDHGWV